MGHIVNPDREHRLLQKQLDRKVQGAPDSPTLIKILTLLFSPEEANIARQMPQQPTSLESLSRGLNMPRKELDRRLTEMAHRGVVLDIEHKGERYFMLPPVVIGLFEFTFMRARPDMPMAELARLFEEYFTENDRFISTLFQGKTQLFRSFVREESILHDDHTEILDWERASHIVTSASAISVGLCQCHHALTHLGKSCDRPQEVCLSFNHGAKTLVRNGYAREISTAEAMRVLEKSKAAGLAQTGDNVQRKVSFICNCCGCCCHLMLGMKTFDLHHGVVTSNWIMDVDLEKCKGCGKCATACPVNAIEIAETLEGDKKRKWAVRDEKICLGCGVCYSACKFGGATMRPREKRVFTPETAFDQMVAMAIERGKLASLIFDDPQKLSHRALGRIIGVLEKSPPFKAAMAIKPLKSAFLSAVVNGARRKSGKLGEMLK
ncbi:MAG TPA: 4Fe-4S ferredoxin [Nitrospiraceae bacterium]|jgi:ferredoxin/rubrerythrin|nr:MAG: 4Fe-4S ferredoxin [Nitrospirae bacterium GWD2_57_8]HAR45685.1 4Fe-4S ferredoxin [Nitrospiraceae bacterium]HAS53401.1 4Fe-4S ferredoxin [Nitrospiraceae bacterium]